MDGVNEFVRQLERDYPQFQFKPAERDHWSPRQNTIYFNQVHAPQELKIAILHELSHALLEHKKYSTDFELLQMESQAWGKAKQLAKSYKINIPDDHIDDCVDSYRDWLYRRSLCPACNSHGLQTSPKQYRCPNCQTSWQVTSNRFSRPYRLSKTK